MTLNLQGVKLTCLKAQDFQRDFTLSTCLREGKLLSLQMFHRILFLLLIVIGVSCNFLTSLCWLFSVVHEHRLPEYSKYRAYQRLLMTTHKKTIK